ncbi:MAG TPA: Nramp family divalent metal transporter [Opitutaceae bacterium]|nr:Nramp family divalent metal transporter [Opitutaceae bacterium]
MHPTPRTWRNSLGPGFLVAATGVGAGDLIAASVAGHRFGLGVLWVVVLGALFKWVLNDGISRWQLATGTTLIEGWTHRLPRFVGWYFLGFLVLWSFLVAAALASACGVAARSLWPVLPVPAWAAVHALAGFALVWLGRYRLFERIMAWLMGAMFVLVIGCAVPLLDDWSGFAAGLFVPTVPEGSAKFLLGVMGGVGGSVTLLCYGYWIRERGWSGAADHRRSLLDLGVAYGLSGIFGLAMIIIAAGADPADASGNALILALGARLGEILGPFGKLCFLVGFWCAVFTSLLGVWQGVPYLFADSFRQIRRQPAPSGPITRTPAYRWFLAYLALPPLLLLTYQSPLAIVVMYAIAGSFFMPFLATVLLVMNNRRDWVGALKNGPVMNSLLILSLVLFAVLFVVEAAESLARL